VAAAPIRCGIGGWVYPEWRGTFYPPGLARREELGFAAKTLRCIEINSSFYRAPTAAQCAAWAAQVPEGFRFSVKAPRAFVQRRDLTGMAGDLQAFCADVAHLDDRLGPILWQFAPGHRADAQALDTFMAQLPESAGGRRLQHALEVRSAQVDRAALVLAARVRGVALVIEDAPDVELAADISADFVYARIKRSQARLQAGLPRTHLARWAERAQAWASGRDLENLPRHGSTIAPGQPREVYLLCIGAAKHRNPAMAQTLQHLCDGDGNST